ncbi:hypothetical protein L6164_013015 [Bauhinia variegata]|uniref:Uncharacterized protein n=1 Tax=Bauhinia variegata TaxID=167791 RepID=A0ACB9PBS7_BAUVA|nr:hypothetical protein L6164_013015 [Bauhinia variegata]
MTTVHEFEEIISCKCGFDLCFPGYVVGGVEFENVCEVYNHKRMAFTIQHNTGTGSRVYSPSGPNIGKTPTHPSSQVDPPPPGWHKLNTDASGAHNPGDISFGGIVRDEKSRWVKGYSGHLGYNTELWSIYKGISLTV